MHPCEIEADKAFLDMYPKSTETVNTQPLSDDKAKTFLTLTMMEAGKIPEPFKHEQLRGQELPFASAVILQRINAMKLPIQFTMAALLSPYALCNEIGGAVVFLCDCLRHHRDRVVTMSEITGLYPWGFYKPEVLKTIIDVYMKTGRHPWAKVYGVSSAK